MATILGRANSNDPCEVAYLAAPSAPQPDCDPAFTALANEHPGLVMQLRGMFFRASFREFGAELSDGAVLGLGAALYADDNLRGRLVSSNREQSLPLLDLGPLADELLDRQPLLTPKSWGDLPEPLRYIDQALAALPRESLVANPMFVPTQALLDAVVADPDSPPAWGVGRNANLTLTEELVAFAVANTGSSFASGLAGNPQLTPPQEFVIYAIRYPNSSLASGVGQNPRLLPPEDLVAAAIADQDSNLS
jgi:hypothetical protein